MMLNIIPYPNHIVEKQGQFLLTDHVYIVSCKETLELVNDFSQYLSKNYSIDVLLANNEDEHDNCIIFSIVELKDNASHERYNISISQDKVHIEAAALNGMFYALQTLKQLIYKDKTVYIPCVDIDDTPLYSWRGFMLDESRHFYGKDFVKKLINILSFYKINTFHWHLTDDQGWRIAIDKYPKLTQIGAWRKENGENYGGYYTKDDIREVVRYAEERFIDIVPEIDVPGHLSAAIASYPYLSCTENEIEVPSYYGILKNVACAGKQSTYQFTRNVLDEVCELFPYEYIHVGGDEVPKDDWKKCPHCQKMIKDKSLEGEEELQGYFTNEVTHYLQGKGKKIMVWNDILKANNLNDDVIIHHWMDGIGRSKTAKAINGGSKAVISDLFSLYFDYPNEVITLKRAYNFSPLFKKIKCVENILGVQANLWTEHIDDTEKAEEMIFPRMLAVSENAWTKADNRELESFLGRLKYHYKYLIWFETNAFMYDKVKPSFFTWLSVLVKHMRTMAKGSKK